VLLVQPDKGKNRHNDDDQADQIDYPIHALPPMLVPANVPSHFFVPELCTPRLGSGCPTAPRTAAGHRGADETSTAGFKEVARLVGQTKGQPT
jgi:hypothetical protein